MNALFGNKKKPGFQAQKPKIRVERVTEAPKPKPLPSAISKKSSLAPSSTVALQQKKSSLHNVPVRSITSSAQSSRAGSSDDSGTLKVRKRKATRQISPVHQRLESDSEDDGDGALEFGGYAGSENKRRKDFDRNRKLRCRDLANRDAQMTHQADIEIAEFAKSGLPEDTVKLKFQYPNAIQRERYNLLWDKDAIDPATEIMEVAVQVADLYFTKEQIRMEHESDGILRKLTRTRNLLVENAVTKRDPVLLGNFKDAVDAYNTTVKTMMKDGSLARNLDKIHSLTLKSVKVLLQQVYDRAVSPQVDILKKRHAEVENEKDNTYGELRPNFVSEALTLAGLKSDQVFVDLGSGVGNVVLQAALEFGCESFGCEMVDNAAKLAQLQEKEFATRCQLWGIKSGKVQLEHGSFFENQETYKAIKRADVILVNNEVFSADTNGRLVHMFLDCKDGCKIISLQPFIEPGHEITDRNFNDPRHQLEVELQHYYNDWVSWKSEDGDYYISTKNSKRVEAFQRRHGLT